MHSNQKLTKIIAGRTLSGVAPGKNGKGEDVTVLTFDDGSTMNVKQPPGSQPAAPTGGKIKKVRQQGTELDLDLEGGTTLKIITAEATGSVMLRDKSGKLEYAD